MLKASQQNIVDLISKTMRSIHDILVKRQDKRSREVPRGNFPDFKEVQYKVEHF